MRQCKGPAGSLTLLNLALKIQTRIIWGGSIRVSVEVPSMSFGAPDPKRRWQNQRRFKVIFEGCPSDSRTVLRNRSRLGREIKEEGSNPIYSKSIVILNKYHRYERSPAKENRTTGRKRRRLKMNIYNACLFSACGFTELTGVWYINK